MVVSLRTQIDARRAYRKLQKTRLQALRAGEDVVKNLGEIGARYAKTMAPYYTGKTAKLIRVITKPAKENTTATIEAQNPTASRKPKFNLVRWMHTSPNASSHIHSGDEKFMYTTRNYLNSIKKGVATGRYKNIKVK